MRQVGGQIVRGLKRLVEAWLNAQRMGVLWRSSPKILNLFSQVLETLPGERRHARKRITDTC